MQQCSPVMLRLQVTSRRSSTQPLLGRAGVMLTLTLLGSCGPAPPSVPPRSLTILTGNQLGVYHPLGLALADVYTKRLPAVVASALHTTGSAFNVRAVEYGEADLAFTQADVAYFAFHQGAAHDPRPYVHLRAVAVLNVNAVQIVTLRHSDIQSLRDLRGKRVGVGAPGTVSEIAARLILQAGGIEQSIDPKPLSVEDLAAALQTGQVDAGFVVSSYPVPAIGRLDAIAVRLLNIEGALAGRIRAKYPFFRPLVIPAGTYRGQVADIETVGVDNMLVCSSEASEDLAYQLTRLFIESLPTLSAAHTAAASVNTERAVTAPIPMHAGAARYYRERQLFP